MHAGNTQMFKISAIGNSLFGQLNWGNSHGFLCNFKKIAFLSFETWKVL